MIEEIKQNWRAIVFMGFVFPALVIMWIWASAESQEREALQRECLQYRLRR